jgi:hypothetical protein
MMKHEIQKELTDYFDIGGYIIETSMVILLKEFRVKSG